MTNESLERFGTIVFDADFMRQRIRVGRFVVDPVTGGTYLADRTSICCGEWYAFVPDTYKPLVERTLDEVGRNLRGMKLTPATLQVFIDRVRLEIWRQVAFPPERMTYDHFSTLLLPSTENSNDSKVTPPGIENGGTSSNE